MASVEYLLERRRFKMILRKAALLLLVVFPVSTAYGQPRLTISGDPCGYSCFGMMSPGVSSDLFVLVIITGSGDQTVDGAEYRVEGIPSEWAVLVNNGPAVSLALGNPVLGGARVTFDSCVPGSVYGTVVAQHLQVIPTSVVPEFQVAVQPAQPPLNLQYNSAVVFSCGSGGSVVNEVQGTPTYYVNPLVPPAECLIDTPPDTCALVGVEETSWGRIKSLFQD
jgi:hypothetical protein